jgi:hypothetical protein
MNGFFGYTNGNIIRGILIKDNAEIDDFGALLLKTIEDIGIEKLCHEIEWCAVREDGTKRADDLLYDIKKKTIGGDYQDGSNVFMKSHYTYVIRRESKILEIWKKDRFDKDKLIFKICED